MDKVEGKEQIMEDDTIKRSDAIKAVWKPQVKPNELIFDALKTAIESEINNAPSADRPQGEWIDIEPRLNRRRVNKYKRCSHCGFSWARPFDDNYCPNCGARMTPLDGERKEE